MTTLYKPSLFNHVVVRNDGSAIAYNFLWRSLVTLDALELSPFQALTSDFSARPKSDYKLHESIDTETLCKLRFLIPSTFDELDFFHKGYVMSVNRPVLTAMILPTLRCNFNCPYCFEFKHDIDLSEQVISGIKSWVISRLDGKRHFHITWFGGEPLLALSTILHLSEFGQSESMKRAIKFSSSIVTNGYLLNPETVASLQKLNINNFHITLDGDIESHNSTRYLTNGSPTFDRLVENIEMYCEVSRSHLPLSIRINVTDENLLGIRNLLSRFSENVKKSSRIYFRWVWANEASGYKTFVTKKKRPFESLAILYKQAADMGYKIDNPIDETQFNYCEVDFAHHFTIDPRGYVYLCSHKFDPNEAIGHVLDKPDIESERSYKTWIEANPFEDSACMKCKCLPICKGGCRKARVYGSKACIEERFSMDNYVESQYHKHQIRNG